MRQTPIKSLDGCTIGYSESVQAALDDADQYARSKRPARAGRTPESSRTGPPTPGTLLLYWYEDNQSGWDDDAAALGAVINDRRQSGDALHQSALSARWRARRLDMVYCTCGAP